MDLFGKINQAGQTVLMVTHNEVIAQSCDRIFRIEDGRLCPEGGMLL